MKVMSEYEHEQKEESGKKTFNFKYYRHINNNFVFNAGS